MRRVHVSYLPDVQVALPGPLYSDYIKQYELPLTIKINIYNKRTLLVPFEVLLVSIADYDTKLPVSLPVCLIHIYPTFFQTYNHFWVIIYYLSFLRHVIYQSTKRQIWGPLGLLIVYLVGERYGNVRKMKNLYRRR